MFDFVKQQQTFFNNIYRCGMMKLDSNKTTSRNTRTTETTEMTAETRRITTTGQFDSGKYCCRRRHCYSSSSSSSSRNFPLHLPLLLPFITIVALFLPLCSSSTHHRPLLAEVQTGGQQEPLLALVLIEEADDSSSNEQQQPRPLLRVESSSESTEELTEKNTKNNIGRHDDDDDVKISANANDAMSTPAFWRYLLAGPRKTKKQMGLLSAPQKRQPVRRCGTLLIKHIQTVCNGCLRSASDADPIMMSKRSGGMAEFRQRWKRQGFSKITDICCTQRACADQELKPLCC